MPTESDSKASSEVSELSSKGCLARCGITLPLLKRKRVSSPLPSRRKPTQQFEPKVIDVAEDYSAEVNDLFDAALGDIAALQKYSKEHDELLREEDEEMLADRDSRLENHFQIPRDDLGRAGMPLVSYEPYENMKGR
ncbi:hypothetical protein SNOG_10345 [Parastagonospora nodorum SN15]|uniref:Uncharacterized protein n=1 Tax=Phaeosphaeria nodorum (strain SN15 / ATCC MYA-4574 / FGSC 10173) TaxID=321614 RepID=Q0UD19_PHANO|nr:hypothetical protein SNOG_10345 [Parastagonospora nodorum SN15]EAT82680.1 hypothetical protein SNOG_10345 [Parastagonospora nodorum SN15]